MERVLSIRKCKTNKGTLWKFNMHTEWIGGFFERMMKILKQYNVLQCLRKVLSNSRLDYNEMLTLLKEIQNILNNLFP